LNDESNERERIRRKNDISMEEEIRNREEEDDRGRERHN